MNTTEETALSVRTEQGFELAPSAAMAEKQFEIQSAIIVAKRFPRNEDAAFEKLMKSSRRTSFAEDAAYSFPRGDTAVEGPSVNIAREAARLWGNVRYGIDIIRDDEESRLIRGWAFDMESNVKVTAEDDFKKLVFRKKGGWIKPDERDLRELTNRRGAILVRNCILQILPKDLIEDALVQCKATLRSGAQQDPEGARKKMILAFSTIHITPEMLELKLGHPIPQCTPDELAELRGIYKSILDGNSKWVDYVAQEPKENGIKTAMPTEKPALTTTSMSPGGENRGHGNENLSLFNMSGSETVNDPDKKQPSGFPLFTPEGTHQLDQEDPQYTIASSRKKPVKPTHKELL